MSFFKEETTLPADESRPPSSDTPVPPDVVRAPAPRGISRFRLLLLIGVTVVNAALSGLLGSDEQPVRTAQLACVLDGAPCCEYRVTWDGAQGTT